MRRLTLAVVLASAVLVAGVATADTTPSPQPTVHEPQHGGSDHGGHGDTHHGSHDTDCDCPHHGDDQINHEDRPRHERGDDRSHGTNRR